MGLEPDISHGLDVHVPAEEFLLRSHMTFAGSTSSGHAPLIRISYHARSIRALKQVLQCFFISTPEHLA